jgi:hypothetical protein
VSNKMSFLGLEASPCPQVHLYTPLHR